MKKILITVVCLVGLFILINTSGARLQAREKEETTKQLLIQVSAYSEPQEVPSETATENLLEVKEEIVEENKSSIDFSLLPEDTIGWMFLESADMFFPVMQADDNNYYLTHNYDGTKDKSGSIFLDCNCSLSDTYSIVYGHNMTSTKSMFYDLFKVNVGDSLRIETKDGEVITYTCLTVYDSTVKDAAFLVGYKWNETLLSFVNSAIKAGNGETLSLDDIQNHRIVSLVTCNTDYAGEDGRRIVVFIED